MSLVLHLAMIMAGFGIFAQSETSDSCCPNGACCGNGSSCCK